MIKKFIIFIIIFVSLILEGCLYESKLDRDYRELMQTIDRFNARCTRRRNLLLDGSIQIGMARQEVLSILGNPNDFKQKVTAEGVSEVFIYRVGDGQKADLFIENNILKEWEINSIRRETQPRWEGYQYKQDIRQQQPTYQQQPSQYRQPQPETCISCGGTGSGILPCFSCGGSGMTGMLKCFVCNGTGFPKCTICGGTGVIK